MWPSKIIDAGSGWDWIRSWSQPWVCCPCPSLPPMCVAAVLDALIWEGLLILSARRETLEGRNLILQVWGPPYLHWGQRTRLLGQSMGQLGSFTLASAFSIASPWESPRTFWASNPLISCCMSPKGQGPEMVVCSLWALPAAHLPAGSPNHGAANANTEQGRLCQLPAWQGLLGFPGQEAGPLPCQMWGPSPSLMFESVRQDWPLRPWTEHSNSMWSHHMGGAQGLQTSCGPV